MKERLKEGSLYVVCAVIVLALSLFLFRTDLVGYFNEDATWHALLTITAYDETPISIHHFVPLVSLGAPDDKNINWGTTLLGRGENYYYTSFSSVGYVLPWAFMKCFHLPVTESSLYLFNRILMLLSAWALIHILWTLYKGQRHAWILILGGGMLYLLTPELLHSMGVIYWHQSVYQLTFLLQLLCYLKKDGSRAARAGFYLLCVFNPFLEWTGYVANVGFALVIAWKKRVHTLREFIRAMMPVALCTVAAGLIFLLQSITVMEPWPFIKMCGHRFKSRVGWLDFPALFKLLIRRYGTSFLGAWFVLLLAAVLFLALKAQKRPYVHEAYPIREILFLTAFPVLENICMLGHAVGYSFDRMKLAFPMVFLFCALANAVLQLEKRRAVKAVLMLSVAAAGIFNLVHYKNDTDYIMPADYLAANQSLAQKVEQYRDDSVMGISSYVRGYVNLLFHRGVYETIDKESLIEIAKEKDKRYVLYGVLDLDSFAYACSEYPFLGVELWDSETETWQMITP